MKLTYQAMKLVLALGLFTWCPAQSFAQTCTANFTQVQTSPNHIQFTGTTTGSPSSASYSWNMGDSQTEYGASPLHVYNVPGLYTVCLTVSDSLSGTPCSSHFCDTVRVTGHVICNLQLLIRSLTMASCATCADGTADVSATNGTAPFTYSWSDGSTNPTLTAAPGYYYVNVTDVNGCWSADSIRILYAGNCLAGFTKTQTANNTIQFTNTSSDTILSRPSFYWNFGDGGSSNAISPSHIYLNPGMYTVSLNLQDSAGNSYCHNTYTDTVSVTGTVICSLSLNFHHSDASCSSCHDGWDSVYVYGNYTAPLSFSWSNGSANNMATGLAPGIVTLCATDANGCHVCQPDVISFAGTHSCHALFTLRNDSSSPGNYVIVNQATGSGTLHYDWSWGDGTPDDTTATPTHTYSAAAHIYICLSISDGAGCVSSYCDSTHVFRMGSGSHTTIHVVKANSTGIHSLSELNGWSVYPNPSNGEVAVSYNLSQASATDISLYNLLGEKVETLQNTSMQSAGAYKLSYDTGSLKAGVYLIRIRTTNSTDTRRLTILR